MQINLFIHINMLLPFSIATLTSIIEILHLVEDTSHNPEIHFSMRPPRFELLTRLLNSRSREGDRWARAGKRTA